MQDTNTMNTKLLSIRDLIIEYHAGGEIVHAINGISLEVDKGQTLGLVGETGAGKTTIAKSVLQILPDPPAKVIGGSVKLNGQELMGLSPKKMRKICGKRISMIFQDPMTALNPVFVVGDQIAEVIQLHENVNKIEAAQKAGEMLKMVGINPERYNEYPHQFSGGMKQRVVIAMALAYNPELIIADEPTTALDVTIQAQVLDMINNLKKQQRTSMILITHDFGVVAEVCDTVAVMYAGEIVEYATKEEVFDYPLHPYTQGLFESIPKLNEDIDRLQPISGLPPNPVNLPKGCHFNPRCKYATEACHAEGIPFAEIRPGHFVRCCNVQEQEG